eukprot:2805291-Lingulodinium_polyedra.AAC.1
MMLRDCYVAIESLRNSWDLITGHMSMWVTKRLSFKAPRSAQWCEERTKLWDSLGLNSELTDLLASVLELEFIDGRLFVKDECE